jgi:hypothetical protein
MIFTGKRKRSLDQVLSAVKNKKRIAFSVPLAQVEPGRLKRVGFSELLEDGETVLPLGIFGACSRRNVSGGLIIHRDKPMEVCYRQAYWQHKEFRGRREPELVSKIVDIRYLRYPRTNLPAHAAELSIGSLAAGTRVVLSDWFENAESNKEAMLHTFNLFLEIFGMVEILADGAQIVECPLRRLNWKILPPGPRPWETIRDEIDEFFRFAKPGNRTLIGVC